jgi:O-antigen/teichoic acid export membrane protein
MALGFISFPLLTRTLSVAEYGVLNVVMRVALLSVILAKLGLPHAMVRFHADDARSPDRAIVERYYSTLIVTAATGGLAVTVLYLLVTIALPAQMVSRPVRILLLLGAAIVFGSSLNALLTGVLRAAGRSREYAALQLALKAALIGSYCLMLFLWERTARALLTANAAAEILTAVILTTLFVQRGLMKLSRFDSGYSRTLIRFALPLVAFEMASSVLDTGDRLVIQAMLGSEAVGLYSAAYNVSSYVQDLLFSSLNLALVPMFIKIWADQGKEATSAFLSSSFNDFALVCCLLCCGAAVCSGDALVLLASAKYQQAASMVPVLVIGLVLYTFATFFNAGLYLNGRTGTMAGVVVASAVFNLVLNILFLKRFGIIAAVYATGASYAFLLAGMSWFSFRHLPLRIDWLSLATGILAAVAVAWAVSRLNFGHPAVNVLMKGSISAAGYAGLLLLMNSGLRARVATLIPRGAKV